MRSKDSFQKQCEDIARIFSAQRKRLGLSKYAVEQRCGVSQQMIGYVERGIRKPSLEIALKIASGLDLDFADVVRRTTPS